MDLTTLQIILLTLNINFIILGLFLIFIKKGNRKSNRILATLIIISGFVNIHFVFLYGKQVYLNFPHLIGTHVPFLFLISPLIFIFYKSVFNADFKVNRGGFLHLLPALVIFIVYLPLYFSSVEYKVNFIETGVCFIPFYLLGGMFFVQFFMYLSMILRDIYLILKVSKVDLSIHLKLYYQTAGILISSLMVMLLIVFFMGLSLIYFSILTSIIYYFIIYLVLAHPEIFYASKFASPELTKKKYRSNSLDKEVVERIYNQVLDFIRREQIYLDFNVSLPEIAYRLNIPTHQLSQAINRKSHLNFNDFINKFRSEHCKEILLDDSYQHYTMAAIGELAGFKSRQTFIKSFKKFYNQTPSEFLKIHRELT